MSIMELTHIYYAVIGILLFVWCLLTILLEGSNEIEKLVKFYEEEEKL